MDVCKQQAGRYSPTYFELALDTLATDYEHNVRHEARASEDSNVRAKLLRALWGARAHAHVSVRVGGAIRGVGVVRVEDGVVDGTNERHGHRDDEDAAVGWGGGGQWGGCSHRRQQRSVNEREYVQAAQSYEKSR